MRRLRHFSLLLFLLMILPAFVFAQSATTTPAPLPQPTTTPTPTAYPLVPTTPAEYSASATAQVQPYYGTATFAPSPLPVPLIEFGEEIAGVFSAASRYQQYTFRGEAGQVVILQFVVSRSIPNITLSYTGYSYPYTQPDVNGNYTVVMVNVLPYTGDHQITLDDYYNSDPNPRNFSLEINSISPQAIAYDESVTTRLTEEQPANVFAFSGEQGDLIALNLASPTFSPYMALSVRQPQNGQPELTSIASPAYQGGGVAELPLYRLPATGEYLIIVRGQSNPTVGEYTLNLSHIVPTPITIDEQVEGEFTAGVTQQFYTFAGEAGDILDFNVSGAENLDTRIALFNPDLQPLTSDDDSGTARDPEINRQPLMMNADYIVQVSPFERGQEGAFSLLVSRAEDSSLDDGPQIAQLNKPNGGIFTFNAEAGQHLRLTLRLTSGSGTPNVLIMQNNQQLLNLSGTNFSQLTGDFVAAQDGLLIVTLSANYPDTVVEVSIEPVESAN